MKELKAFLQSPEGAHVDKVYFNEHGHWLFCERAEYPYEQSAEQVLAEPDEEKHLDKVKKEAGKLKEKAAKEKAAKEKAAEKGE